MLPSISFSLLLVLIKSIIAASRMDVASISDGITGVGFNVIHRDAPRSKIKTRVQLNADINFKDVIQYVQARRARHHRSVDQHHNRKHGKKAVSGFTSPVVTLGQAGLEYYVPLQVGTPPVEVVLIMDTGSDVSWIQCVPCRDCVPALRPPFNPRHSSSFVKLPCTSSTCTNLYQGVKPACSPSGRTCLFSIQYADGSLSSGLLAMETIGSAFGGGQPVMLANITLGCADVDREGVPTGASGLLGMDSRPISFPSQLGSRYSRKFSHCFPDKIAHLNSSGLVLFGESDMVSPHLHYTPLLQNTATPGASLDYYYIGLVGVSVDGKRLPLSHKNFAIDKVTGSGGTIIDSGTAFTYLKKAAFAAMRRAFVARTTHLARVDDKYGFTTCYNISNGDDGTRALESIWIPSITLHFLGDLEVVLPKNSILIPVSGSQQHTTLCLAFQVSDTVPFNVIGNYQQQNLWIQYDLDRLRLGIAPAECAID